MAQQYVDAFVIPMKKKDLAAYKKAAKVACKVWMKHGAVSYAECLADDYVTDGLGFKKMCKLKADETVVITHIVYKSKADRNRINKVVMPYLETVFKDMKMPFDLKRFAMAGCKVIISG